MKNGYDNPYATTSIKNLHKIIDEADPFLVESLAGKNQQELMESLDKAEKYYQIAIKVDNREFIDSSSKTVKTISAVLELRRVRTEMEEDLKGKNSDENGYSLL